MSADSTATQGSNGYDPRKLYEQGLAFGQADLVVGAPTKQVIGRTAALSLFFRDSSDDRPLFLGITVVAPPQAVWQESDEQILEMILEGTTYLRSTKPLPEEITSLRQRLTIRRCENLSTDALLAQVEIAAGTERQFILIPMAHVYVDETLEKPTPYGRTSVILSEDRWVPQIVSWAPKCIRAIKGTQGYLVVDVPEFPPGSAEHRQRLIDIEDLFPAFAGWEGETDPAPLIQEHAPRWTMLAQTGRMDEALQEIKALDIADAFKRQLEIQILSRGPDLERTINALREFDTSGQKVPPDLVARFGHIAHQAGDDALASSLIGSGINQIVSQPILEATLLTCERLKDPDLESRAYFRLAALFPTSAEIHHYHERLAIKLAATGLGTHAEEMANRIPLPIFERTLIGIITGGKPQTDTFIELTSQASSTRERDLILVCGATDSLAKKDSGAAITLAIRVSNAKPFTRLASLALLAAMRRRLLEEVGPYEVGTPFSQALSYVRNFIATNPHDAEIREAFASLFSVNISAELGLPILTTHALNLASEGLDIAQPGDSEPEADSTELGAFLERVAEWQRRIPGFEVGFTTMPLEVVGGNPTAILNGLGRSIRHLTNGQQPNDLEQAQHFSFLACLVARYIPDASVDINALRMIASRRILVGQSQQARDLAEQILQLARDSRLRQRLAWAAYADIYHRAHNPLDALVGLNCAFALDQKIEAEDAWWETYTLLRVARDLGLASIAKHLLASLKALQALIPGSTAHEIRLESLELGLRMLDHGERDLEALKKLANDAEQHCRNLRGAREEQLPALSLLAQAIGFLERAGGIPSDAARSLLHEGLASLEPEQVDFVRASAATTPTIEDALTMRSRLQKARYADDVPSDLMAIALAARRLLRNHTGMSPAETASAIELLYDHGLDTPAARPLDTKWPLPFLTQMVPPDGAILMAALDADGDLITLAVRADETAIGKLTFEGPSFARRLAKWSENYPFEYGTIDRSEGNNVFFQTMEEIPVPLPPGRRIIVVGEPRLQLIPLNLLLVNNDFAGYSIATAYVPSLTWLESVRKQPQSVSTRRIAWLSEARQEGDSSAIELVLNVTRDTLTRTSFELFTDTSVPEGLSEAQIAIVTAHGSVSTGGKYFHRISDEGELVLAPRALASASGGAELVILFICSAGRTDPHPFLNTAVGLPKLLLAAGSRTVIASPWPLSPLVTGPWLDAFLDAWEAGKTVLDANFIANSAVHERYGYVPQYSLAMSVYGDPYLRKQSMSPHVERRSEFDGSGTPQ